VQTISTTRRSVDQIHSPRPLPVSCRGSISGFHAGSSSRLTFPRRGPFLLALNLRVLELRSQNVLSELRSGPAALSSSGASIGQVRQDASRPASRGAPFRGDRCRRVAQAFSGGLPSGAPSSVCEGGDFGPAFDASSPPVSSSPSVPLTPRKYDLTIITQVLAIPARGRPI